MLAPSWTSWEYRHHVVPSADTTTFQNTYSQGDRPAADQKRRRSDRAARRSVRMALGPPRIVGTTRR